MKDYIQRAVKTESPTTDELKSRLTNSTNIRSLHAVLGMASELNEIESVIQELDTSKGQFFLQQDINKKLIDELGDYLWYLALFTDANCLDLQYEYCRNSVLSEKELYISLANQTSQLSDVYKKHIYYGKPIKIDLQNWINTTLSLLMNFAHKADTSLHCIQQKNIAKLSTRYKDDKFTENQAINRDLKKEEAVFNT